MICMLSYSTSNVYTVALCVCVCVRERERERGRERGREREREREGGGGREREREREGAYRETNIGLISMCFLDAMCPTLSTSLLASRRLYR